MTLNFTIFSVAAGTIRSPKPLPDYLHRVAQDAYVLALGAYLVVWWIIVECLIRAIANWIKKNSIYYSRRLGKTTARGALLTIPTSSASDMLLQRCENDAHNDSSRFLYSIFKFDLFIDHILKLRRTAPKAIL